MNDVAPQPSRPDGGQAQGQREIVCDYFADASASWGGRYHKKPRGMADLDLLLRRENVHRLLRPLLAGAARRLRVLDVGCGTGDVLDGLPRDCMSVTGVDMVPEMVAEAQRTHPGDTFRVADAAELPFEPGSMDVITSLGVLEYVPDPSAVLRSMWTVLAPGGHLIMSFPNRLSPFRRMRRWERLAERAVLGALRWVGLRRGSGGGAASYGHAHWSTREVVGLLSSSGFAVERMVFQNYGMWGRLGRLPLSLGVSRWMSRRISGRNVFSALMASTMVVLARKGGGAACVNQGKGG